MNKLTVKDLDLKGKRVLIRVDFNVPMDKGKITDDTRIAAALPTIHYCLDHGASVVLTSHMGRPKGKRVEEYSLKPTAVRLSELLGKPVQMADDCIGPDVEAAARALKLGQVLLLENVRFHEEDEACDAEFAKKLASLADLYVCDAFGSAHRAHASVSGVADYLTSAAGLLLEKEIEYLGRAIAAPEKPFAVILGGAKVSSKIELIENLLDKVDLIIVGGGMSYTFLKSQGFEVGNSLLEKDHVGTAKDILAKAAKKKVEFILPVDVVVANDFDNPTEIRTVDASAIPKGFQGMDTGPKTIALFKQKLANARTIVWNGPVGVFEKPPFDAGTRALAQAVGALDATTIIGGGDTAAAINQFGLDDEMTHISTGGGASLEFLEGKQLPGVVSLTDK